MNHPWVLLYLLDFTKKSIGSWCRDWEEARKKKKKDEKIHLPELLLFWKPEQTASIFGGPLIILSRTEGSFLTPANDNNLMSS